MSLPQPAQDPTGMLLVELRDYLRANGWADVVVRAGELPGGDDPAPGLVLLRRAGGTIRRRIGVQDPRWVATCYGPRYMTDGVTPDRDGPRKAAELAMAVVAAVQDRGPRTSGTRALYSTAVLSYGNPGRDPDTGWPLEQVTIGATAPLMVLP